VREAVVMHDESARPLVPIVSSLDAPALGEHNEAVGIGLDGEQLALAWVIPGAAVSIGRAADDFDGETALGAQRLRALSGIAAIDKERLHRGVLVLGSPTTA
jgi:hypothetical protein